MIKLVNALALIVTVVFSFGLYSLKYYTGVAADRVRILESKIAEQDEALRILRAEWSHLNQADRLQTLAERYLDLEPLGPTQLAKLRDLPLRSLVDEEAALEGLVNADPFANDDGSRAILRVRPQPKPTSYTRGGNRDG